jgi:hypothetical protein
LLLERLPEIRDVHVLLPRKLFQGALQLLLRNGEAQ